MELDPLKKLLEDIDRWCIRSELDAELILLGGAALALTWETKWTTKDLDVVVKGKGEIEEIAAVFGEGSGRRPWLDVVLAGIPRLPEGWNDRAVPVEGAWERLVVRRLSDADLIASKLKGFRPQDRRDIAFICKVSPGVRASLAALSAKDYWMEPDVWEYDIEPNRDGCRPETDAAIHSIHQLACASA
jgi:hypothetical protein